jgi:hypothetical protein
VTTSKQHTFIIRYHSVIFQIYILWSACWGRSAIVVAVVGVAMVLLAVVIAIFSCCGPSTLPRKLLVSWLWCPPMWCCILVGSSI